MDEAIMGRAAGNRHGLSLSPPPAEVELEIVASGARLLGFLVGRHEYVIDIEDIASAAQRELASRAVEELRQLAEVVADDRSTQPDIATARAQQLMVELLEAELLTSVGGYERRLTTGERTTAWNGLVVRVAPAAVVAGRQLGPSTRPAAPTRRDQRQLDELLGLLTRSSMRLIRDQDFAMPWPEEITTPLDYFVREYDEVEHRFADAALEERRQVLLQASHVFLHQEAMNGFSSRLTGKGDGGWTPGDAAGDPHREGVLESRRQILVAAANDLLLAYDDIVASAGDAGYAQRDDG